MQFVQTQGILKGSSMTDKKTTVKTGNTVGTLLLMGATAIVTAIAVNNAERIKTAGKGLLQHMADGTFKWPPAGAMNGSTRTPATAPR
jgi:hypothetical protein